MRTKLRSKVTLLFMTLGLLLAVPAWALAADLLVAEMDVAPNNSVTVEQGKSATFNMRVSANGNLSCQITEASPATAKVKTSYNVTKSGTSVVGAASATSPFSPVFGFWSSGTCAAGNNHSATWGTSPNPYIVPATISVASDVPPGTYTNLISISSATGETQITNPSITVGAPLEDKDATRITVVVTAATNAPPVANTDTLVTNEDIPNSVNVLTNDTDPNGDALTVAGNSNGTKGSVSCQSGGQCTYTPNPNSNGADSFTYNISDGKGGTAQGTVNVTVNPVNDAPVAADDGPYVTDEDIQLNVAAANGVLANDSDVEGSALSAVLVNGPAHASSFSLNPNGSFSYTPNDNYNGADSFTYRASDGTDSSTVATASITVTPVNDPPATPGAINSDELINNDGTFTLSWGVSSDVDGDNLTYTLEQRDADDTAWSEVPSGSGLTSASYTFGGSSSNAAQLEGTWDFRVKAVDSPAGASSDFSTAENLVNVDKTNPNAPTLSFATGAGQSLKVTVNSVDWYKDSALINVSDNGDPNNVRDNSTGSGVDATSFPASFSVTQNGTSTAASKTVKDRATNESAASTPLEVNVDAANPTLGDCPGPASFLVNSGSGTPTTQSVGPIDANDGESGIDSANSQLSGSVNTSSTGTKTVIFTAKDRVGHSVQKSCDYTVRAYDFIGFSSPVDNPNYLNVLKAGQAIPLKWRLMDNGSPVTNLASVTVKVQSLSCSLGTTADQLEEVAAGGSSLQNLGDGYYQFNWKSPSSYAGSCKTLTVSGVGVEKSAYFRFTK